MGLFSRRTPAPVVWRPPSPPDCACSRHLDDDLRATVVPFAPSVAEDLGREPEPATVADLLGPGGLSVRPAHPDDQRSGEAHLLTWDLGVYDDARAHYDDDTVLDLDAALAAQPGIDLVDWQDREVFLLAAPTLCADGVLAAAALALLDDRVRTPR